MTESALNDAMERYSTGDDAAFGEIYDALAPRLYGFLQRQVQDRALAEDLLQQTLLQLHRARGRYTPGADVLPWVFAIARRLTIDTHRIRRREVLVESPDAAASESPVSGADYAESLVQARQMARAVNLALEALPESQRVAYQLVRDEGLSMTQAAAVLGTTASAVKLRAFRAYEAIRNALGIQGALP
jgi:RNA polymerase sigma-70 factor, ECF subfamily